MSSGDVDALEDKTEGWAAALQLAAMSLVGRPDPGAFIAGFAGDDRYLVDYLLDEVLDRQAEAARSFLLQTSIAERLCGPLCDVLIQASGSREMLRSLDRADLFLIALDDRRVWYRYHHLFADILRSRLLDEQPALVPELHRRASVWFEGAGDTHEAIEHAGSSTRTSAWRSWRWSATIGKPRRSTWMRPLALVHQRARHRLCIVSWWRPRASGGRTLERVRHPSC